MQVNPVNLIAHAIIRLCCASLLLCCCLHRVQAQSLVGYEKMKPLDVPVYERTYPDLLLKMLPTDFAASSFTGSKDTAVPANIDILFIELVYTEYPAGNNFENLNRRRLLWLARKLPPAALNSNPPVRLVRQTQAKNKTDAEKLFHGFAIYHREKPGPEATKKEVSYLKKLVAETPPVVAASPEQVRFHYTIPARGKDSGTRYYFCHDSIAIAWLKKNGVAYEVLTPNEMFRRGWILPKVKEMDFKTCFSFIVTRRLPPPSAPEPEPAKKPDAVVWNVLKRNGWNKMLVCMDVTTSMSKYTGQLFTWLQMQQQQNAVRFFAAFNDGDDTPDNKKKTGQTGGIYTTASPHFTDITATAYTAMSKGGGGDIPENNIEALLKGIAGCPQCTQVVLIADNWAPVKDMALLPQLKLPVKVILCGVSTGYLQTDYLNIARATGGSVHTQEDDFTNLAQLKEGEVFAYRGATYRVVNNRFVNESHAVIKAQ